MVIGSLADLGLFEVTHKIEKGESISKIADNYIRMGWPVPSIQGGTDAIWRLNTLVYDNLSDRDNPDQIFPDDFLVIPRSRAGYERNLLRLSNLQRQVADDDSVAMDLKKIKSDADRTGKQLDLAADVATLFVGVGLKCMKLIKAGEIAGEATKIALRDSIKEQEEIAIDITKDFGKFATGKAVDAIADASTENDTVKTVASKAHTAAWDISKAKDFAKLVKTGEAQKLLNVKSMEKTVFHGAAKGAVGLLHVADILLDFVSPSWIANKITGLDQTMKQSEEYAKNSKARLLKELGDRIAKKRDEMELVWPSK
jgi:LysM domain